MAEIEAIKYSYNNTVGSRVILILRDKSFYYRNTDSLCICRPSLKRIDNIVGLVYGTKTSTWCRKVDIARPELCFSLVCPERTYDFQLLSSRELFKVLNFSKDIRSTSLSRIGEPISSLSPDYIDYVFTICCARFPIRTDNYKDWFAKNITVPWGHISQDVFLWKTITDSEMKVFNDGCCICLDEFVPDSQCVILDCNHILHKDCWRNYIYSSSSRRRRTSPCPLCNN